MRTLLPCGSAKAFELGWPVIETTLQYTCDGCGETEIYPNMDATKRECREYLRAGGWRSYGVLDYCKRCVKNGNSRRRVTDMNH